jgi:homoserine O-acetyltransferase
MDSLIGVEKQRLALGAFPLVSGTVLPQVALAFETYGRLAPDGRNAVLVTHGYTSSAHAAGRHAAADAQPGWWDGVIGPGKAIDTERCFVICSNMLGSSFGSTGPASIDPRTGLPYGPDFPEIELADIVAAQRRLVQALGVEHLIAVAGVSYGGFQALQWGVSFPESMDGICVVCSAPQGRGPSAIQQTTATLAADPHWNGGRFYETGGVFETMRALRLRTLTQYGYQEALAGRIADAAAREAELQRLAAAWAREFDANSLLTLGRASARFDVVPEFAKLRAKVLYVLSTSDKLFPPTLAPVVMAKFRTAGVDADYFALESAHGHVASTSEPDKWAPALRQFLGRITR